MENWGSNGDPLFHGNAAGARCTGRLIGITYPSGQRIDHLLDAAGRIQAIDRNSAGAITPLIGSITYEPFGPANGWSYGNGLTESRNFDLAGRLSEIRGALELGFGYDGAGNLISLGAPLTLPDADDRDEPLPLPPAVVKPVQGYAYDVLHRLQQVQDGKGDWIRQWHYDPVGNRRSEETPGAAAQPDPGDGDEPFTPPGIAASTETYGYAADSNRLIEIGGIPRTHDAVGNLTDDGVHQYTYDDRNRLVGVDAVASYKFNGRGERVGKTVSGVTTYFVYGQGGQLLGEYRASGAPIKEYVYLQGAPVAVMTDDAEYYIHTDHLGTPREATDEFGSTVWRWSLLDNAFGDRPAEPVSYGDSDEEHQPLTLNLRFPGQYFDAESGLHYNYFRDYEPSTGRYIESDPLGVKAGVNAFLYTFGNPNSLIDFFGLEACTDSHDCLEKFKQCREKAKKSWRACAEVYLGDGRFTVRVCVILCKLIGRGANRRIGGPPGGGGAISCEQICKGAMGPPIRKSVSYCKYVYLKLLRECDVRFGKCIGFPEIMGRDLGGGVTSS